MERQSCFIYLILQVYGAGLLFFSISVFGSSKFGIDKFVILVYDYFQVHQVVLDWIQLGFLLCVVFMLLWQ